MPNPTGFSQHDSGYWRRDSDQSGPYAYDGTNVVSVNAPLPIGATAVSSASGNVAAASAVATLAASATKTTYVSGFVITGAGATAPSVVSATLAGLLGGTATYTIAVPTGATAGLTPLIVQFDSPLPGSAVNTAIVLTLPSLGVGNTNASVHAWGYQL